MFNKYENLTDEECIAILRDGDTFVMDYLLEKYKNLVRKKAGKLFILGGDDQDLIQEGMIGLFKAIRDYDPGRDASFYTFAELCISRNIYSAISKSNRDKNIPLNTYVSIYRDEENEEKPDGFMEDKMMAEFFEGGNDINNPESILINDENLKNLECYIDKELSGFEKQVLELHIAGINYKEIARILGKEEKSTDNCLQRIKSKIKKFKQDK